MALQSSTNNQLLSILKVNGKGWNISLFQDQNKISQNICGNCNGVCDKAVELGCISHSDNDIFVYCSDCLAELIKNNDNKCPINLHSDPTIIPNRSIRRQILSSKVICPYSNKYIRLNNYVYNNRHVAITDKGNNAHNNDNDDGKEGVFVINKNGCLYNDTLSNLIKNHLEECAMKHDPNYIQNIINDKDKENISLQKQINKLNQIVKKLKKENISLNIELKIKNNETKNKERLIKNLKEENKKLKDKLNDNNQLQNDDQKDNDAIPCSLDQLKEFDAIIVNTYHANCIYTDASDKVIWDVKNTGIRSFGNDCRLAFVSGDGLIISQYSIHNAKPNETVRITMDFAAFSTLGAYVTHFRLSNDGIQFGTALNVEITVKTNVIKNDGWFNWSKKKPIKKYVESAFICLCGVALVSMDVKQAYKGKKVYCDVCNKICNHMILHCPSGDIKQHPGGFDLCTTCATDQLGRPTPGSGNDK